MNQITLRGSCLCGALAYEITGEPLRFVHCHCSRCRKASGAAHASNIVIKTSECKLEGETGLVTEYSPPGAERFTVKFCRRCGSRVPTYRRDSEVAVVPAGTLDDDVIIRPQARIYWGSRSGWSCDDGPLPHFDQSLPPGAALKPMGQSFSEAD